MSEEPPEDDDRQEAVAEDWERVVVVCGRFLLGVGAGVVLWVLLVGTCERNGLLWNGYPTVDWLVTWQGMLGLPLICGLTGVVLPTMAALLRAVLSRLPFFDRYDWQ